MFTVHGFYFFRLFYGFKVFTDHGICFSFLGNVAGMLFDVNKPFEEKILA